MTLADRFASAGPEKMQRKLLRELWTSVHGWLPSVYTRDSPEPFDQFMALMAIGTDPAFLAAAMMLIPGDCCVHQMGNVPDNGSTQKWWVALWRDGDDCDLGENEAATPALALGAAIARSMGL